MNLIIFHGSKRLLNSFIKKYIFKCVNCYISSFFFSFQNRILGLKLDYCTNFCCCLATMYVSNDQVNINSLVAFMKPCCIQKTYATMDIAILVNVLHRLIILPLSEKGSKWRFPWP